jgi:hypothetical protein
MPKYLAVGEGRGVIIINIIRVNGMSGQLEGSMLEGEV